MKKNLFILLSFLLAIISAGCTNDDDSENPLTVNFQLQNEDGDECYSFHEGENIIFRLEIINNSEEDLIIHDDIGYIIGNDIFHVYSSNGKDFGTPYDMLLIPEVGLTSIPSKNRISFLCPWVNNPESEVSWNPHYLNYEIDKLRPLPKGDYYSLFTIRLNDNRNVTCKKAFKIE